MQPLEKNLLTFFNIVTLQEGSRLAVACSGGPDSLALALLAQAFAETKRLSIVALIVDHRLRAESGKEAERAQAWLTGRGIASEILCWQGAKPSRNIQEAAREARYRLLRDYCKREGIKTLLLGHHLEDQAETFLLRLARGSGLDGLSAMAERTELYGMTLLRPLLRVPKAMLLRYLAEKGQDYIHDPSNANEAFGRVKIRGLLPELARVGLTPERLSGTAFTMRRARGYLEQQTAAFLTQHGRLFSEGYARLDCLDVHDEIALRALASMIAAVSGNRIQPRLQELERLLKALRAESFKGATLGGCVFKRLKNIIYLYRELKAVERPLPLKPNASLYWDNRFEICCIGSHESTVGALTQAGWLLLAKTQRLKNPFPSKSILYGLPCIRDQDGTILCVPQLGFNNGCLACEATFRC